MDEPNVWTRERLTARRAELEQGLEAIRDQFRRAYAMQEGALQLVDQMLAELDAPPEDEAAVEQKSRAALRRLERAKKRAAHHANGTQELARVEADA